MNGDGSRCERDAEAGIGCASTCWCKCKWYYGGNCDSSSQGCENLKDYKTNGQCHDENYMSSLAAQAVGTIIGVTLILIIVLPIVLVICICVCICFVCMRRESTIIVNQAAQPSTGVPQGTQSISLHDRPPNSCMGSQRDQVPLETKDIQVSPWKGRETERERERESGRHELREKVIEGRGCQGGVRGCQEPFLEFPSVCMCLNVYVHLRSGERCNRGQTEWRASA